MSVLLLGSGLCAPPLIEYTLKHGFHLVVATRTKEKAEKLLNGHVNGKAVALDVSKPDALDILDGLVQEVDLVVSLLPYIFHVAAAKIALRHKKHFCTTSYISDEMLALDAAAKEAGVILLNECGVDPGLDHMSAQKIIDAVHAKGGKIREFYSICGGLPAPSANNNPLGYKLSWSPRGVLLASRNNAIFLENGEVKNVVGIDLYAEGGYRSDFVEDVGELEWYANRDSVKYIEIYKIPEVQTIIRGTYRYKGWCRMMRKLALFGFTSVDVVDGLEGMSLAAFSARVLGLDSTENLKEKVANKLEIPLEDNIMERLSWLGLFDCEKTVAHGITTALDVVCALFEEKMIYAHGEKDMIVMRHQFDVEYEEGRRERIISTLIDYGLQPEGGTSMSRTVALPVAIAVRAVLEKRLTLTGIVRPVVPEAYNLILEEMEKENVKFVETVLPQQIHLRHEVKENEFRSVLSPEGVRSLINSGFSVNVERSDNRCFKDAEFEAVGAKLVHPMSWVHSPPSTIVLGLKELPEDVPLRQRHVYFAHCFKGQTGANMLLKRFAAGKGVLWDLEFLTDDNGRRVAAFGYPAGYVGCALGLLQWARRSEGGVLKGPLSPWMADELLKNEVRGQLNGRTPTVHVLGALGRAGRGAVDFAESVGAKVIKWDLEETKKGGPFGELLDVDVLVNCIYLSGKITPFLTTELLEKEKKLKVIVDVSCDPNNPNNPLPFYNECTTIVNPILELPSIDVIAIDHLPSLLPESSSIMFSRDLVPSLTLLLNPNSKDYSVWKRAHKLFEQKVAEAL
jgi:saccharopine dehydrogenase (NADP+, L-glutamate forming)